MNACVLALSPARPSNASRPEHPSPVERHRAPGRKRGCQCGRKGMLRKGGVCPGGAGAAPKEHRGPQLSPAERGNTC